MKFFIVALTVLLSGCGVGSLVKFPVNHACKSKGLNGCENITDGIVYYVEGEKQKGIKEFKVALEKNSPEKIKHFLSSIQTIPELKEFIEEANKTQKVETVPSITIVPISKPAKKETNSDTIPFLYEDVEKESENNLYIERSNEGDDLYSILIIHTLRGQVTNCLVGKNIHIEWVKSSISTFKWNQNNIKVEVESNYVLLHTRNKSVVDVIGLNFCSKWIGLSEENISNPSIEKNNIKNPYGPRK
jgi:hypothetical protein